MGLTQTGKLPVLYFQICPIYRNGLHHHIQVLHAFSLASGKCVAIKICEQHEGTEKQVLQEYEINPDNEELEVGQLEFKPSWGCHKEIEVLKATNEVDSKHIVKMLD